MVVLHADLFPSIAVTTSTTTAIILNHWSQDYGPEKQTALVISQYIGTQHFIFFKVIYLEFIRDIKAYLVSHSLYLKKQSVLERLNNLHKIA